MTEVKLKMSKRCPPVLLKLFDAFANRLKNNVSAVTDIASQPETGNSWC